jgi:hypothetical protein
MTFFLSSSTHVTRTGHRTFARRDSRKPQATTSLHLSSSTRSRFTQQMTDNMLELYYLPAKSLCRMGSCIVACVRVFRIRACSRGSLSSLTLSVSHQRNDNTKPDRSDAFYGTLHNRVAVAIFLLSHSDAAGKLELPHLELDDRDSRQACVNFTFSLYGLAWASVHLFISAFRSAPR